MRRNTSRAPYSCTMCVRISRESRTIRENNHGGAFPPCRGSDAYPVLFPGDIDRFYATLWADAASVYRSRAGRTYAPGPSTRSGRPEQRRRATNKRRVDGQDSEEEDRTKSECRLHEAHDAERRAERGNRRQAAAAHGS